ncbi:GNAT family N-acetyltransferase [Pararhizobium gei]|uniref:GNAT family N-acetyltransferase n=1 Tax=Pararhizobium gei TaxID=1395951 RepID=UPI0023D9FB7B|nr:N-acetyltransferase [Rhizobium gei]
MNVRPETPADADAIRRVTMEAFRDHPHSDQTEHLIMDRLRDSGGLSLSLIAEAAGAVVGHVAFSPVLISDGTKDWFGLGPLSVLPSHQRQGFGRMLVEAGLRDLSRQGAAGCVVMGDPNYYGKFGFKSDPRLVLADCAPQYFLAQPLSFNHASGMVTYHAAFYGGADG